jgi:hypothetical protein
VFAGVGEFLRVHGLANGMDGSSEADEVGIEACGRKWDGEAVDQRACSVVDKDEVRQEARRRGDLLKNAEGFRRQRMVLAGGERIRFHHPYRMRC